MKIINNYIAKSLALVLMTFVVASCHDLLDEPLENRVPTEDVDYTVSQDMILPLYGAYAQFYNNMGW